jgi:hypothetical protein
MQHLEMTHKIYEGIRERNLPFTMALVRRDSAVLCCAVLCCAVLCCAVLCCAVLCCAAAVMRFSVAVRCGAAGARVGD